MVGGRPKKTGDLSLMSPSCDSERGSAGSQEHVMAGRKMRWTLGMFSSLQKLSLSPAHLWLLVPSLSNAAIRCLLAQGDRTHPPHMRGRTYILRVEPYGHPRFETNIPPACVQGYDRALRIDAICATCPLRAPGVTRSRPSTSSARTRWRRRHVGTEPVGRLDHAPIQSQPGRPARTWTLVIATSSELGDRRALRERAFGNRRRRSGSPTGWPPEISVERSQEKGETAQGRVEGEQRGERWRRAARQQEAESGRATQSLREFACLRCEGPCNGRRTRSLVSLHREPTPFSSPPNRFQTFRVASNQSRARWL
jgi:hypothetical protein